MSRARRRDRRVYLAGHPALLVLLALSRPARTLRLGRTVLINGTSEVRETLTHLPLDRLAEGTTGAVARELLLEGVAFDQEGAAHRGTRRSINLRERAVEQLRPVWLAVLDGHVDALARGAEVDIVQVSRQMAGATVAAILGVGSDPLQIAHAAQDVASVAVRRHLAGSRGSRSRSGSEPGPDAVAARLNDLVAGGRMEASLAAILAVTAVNTTVAGMPRAIAWCADDGLWAHADHPDRLDALVRELTRIVTPVPVLARVAAADGTVGGRRVRKGDRLLLVLRHAVGAHRGEPACLRPAPEHVTRLAFGAGPHACPGAKLAHLQLADALRVLAPQRPVVVRARPDRHAALPGWDSLVVRAG
jgi:cytochrome P450